MNNIKRINHIGLRVRDLNTSRPFYEKLGFNFLYGPTGPEPLAVMEHPSGININFILNAATSSPVTNVLMDIPEKLAGYTHIALEIDDAEVVQKKLEDMGHIITEVVRLETGAVFLFIRDPDNNVIEFHMPAKA